MIGVRINYYGACVPRMRKEVTACERRDRQSNAVQEIEGQDSGCSAPWPSGISSAREGFQTTARGVR